MILAREQKFCAILALEQKRLEPPYTPLENTNLLEKRPLMFETIKIGGFWAHLPCAEGTFCPKMALEIWLDQDGPVTCH